MITKQHQNRGRKKKSTFTEADGRRRCPPSPLAGSMFAGRVFYLLHYRRCRLLQSKPSSDVSRLSFFPWPSNHHPHPTRFPMALAIIHSSLINEVHTPFCPFYAHSMPDGRIIYIINLSCGISFYYYYSIMILVRAHFLYI